MKSSVFHRLAITLARLPKVRAWLVANAPEIGLRGTMDTEKVIRTLKIENIDQHNIIVDLQNALAARRIVYIHTTAPLRAIAAPSSQTTGPLSVESIRTRADRNAFIRQLNDQPSGALARIDAKMRRQKAITQQLGPATERLPAMPKPGSVTRDLRKLQDEEP